MQQGRWPAETPPATIREPSADVLARMLEDARALAQLEDDPVLAPRCSFLVAFLSETLALKDPR